MDAEELRRAIDAFDRAVLEGLLSMRAFDAEGRAVRAHVTYGLTDRGLAVLNGGVAAPGR